MGVNDISGLCASPDPNFPYPCVFAADVNGDGRADVIGFQGELAAVRLSNGSSLAARVVWTDLTFSAAKFPGNPALGDINGDGLADLVWSDGYNIYVQFSSGNGFGPPVNMGVNDTSGLCASPDPNFPYPCVFAADVNGDGRADVIGFGGELAAVRVAQARTPDLITAFTNSLGASTTIPTPPAVPGYKPLTDSTVYTKDTPAATWPVRDLQAQGPMYVVSSVSQTNGVGGSYVTNYKYTGAKVHMTGGGFLGFRIIEEIKPTDTTTTIKTATTFRQDYPFQGLPTSVVKTQSSSAVPLNQVTNTWTSNPAYNALPYTYTSGKYHRADLTSLVESSNDVNGAAFPTVTTTTAYDAYGNAQNITVSTGDGYSKSTANTYTNDTANWFLGRLTRSTVTSTTP